jgi:hypothetical protein
MRIQANKIIKFARMGDCISLDVSKSIEGFNDIIIINPNDEVIGDAINEQESDRAIDISSR